MIPQQWGQPCGTQCTQKYSALTQITCLEECNEICYKDPVLKDQQWSAYIDRSPGSASYSEECFRACKSGCGYKFEIHPEEVDKVRPKRPCNPPPSKKPPPVQKPSPEAVEHGEQIEDVPCISA